MIVPAACLCYDVMMITRLVFVGQEADPVAWRLVRHEWGAAVLIALCLVSVIALVFRRHVPFISLCVTCMVAVAGMMAGIRPYVMLPMFFALYVCVAITDISRMIGGIIVTIAAMLMGSAVEWNDAGVGIAALLPMILIVALVVILGLWSYTARQKRNGMAAIAREHAYATELQRQRDLERRRSDIAAELHDSVGHNLTSIIALTEGLHVALEDSDDGDLREAIESVDVLAREALSQTRHAVRALDRLADPAGISSVESGEAAAIEHPSWNDIRPVLDHARAVGIATALTETGARSTDPDQADLCFRISREAVTNALRHGGECLTRIIVSWDHHQDGSMDIMVRNDGHGEPDGEHSGADGSGSGLARLRARVEAVGGVFTAGPAESGDGWVLAAHLPAGTGDATDDAANHREDGR